MSNKCHFCNKTTLLVVRNGAKKCREIRTSEAGRYIRTVVYKEQRDSPSPTVGFSLSCKLVLHERQQDVSWISCFPVQISLPAFIPCFSCPVRLYLTYTFDFLLSSGWSRLALHCGKHRSRGLRKRQRALLSTETSQVVGGTSPSSMDDDALAIKKHSSVLALGRIFI